VQGEVGSLVGLYDQPLIQHPADRTIQRAGTEVQLPVGAAQNFPFQGVAVALAVAESQQHVEDGKRQRKEGLYRGVLCFCHTRSYYGIVWQGVKGRRNLPAMI